MKYGSVLTASALALALSSPVMAREFTDSQAAALSIRQLSPLQAQLGLRSVQSDLHLRSVYRDAMGMSHVRLDQSHLGIPVFGGQVIVHLSATGKMTSWTDGLSIVDGLVDARPAVASRVALDAAKGYFGQATSRAPEVQLTWFEDADGEVHLAWRIHLVNIESDEPAAHQYIIDARTGALIFDWDDLHTGAAEGTGNSLYSGEVPMSTNETLAGPFEMVDPTRGDLKTVDMNNTQSTEVVFTDTDNAWGDGTERDDATVGVDAHYGARMTHDLYFNEYDRDGIRDDGEGARGRVHYGVGYNNAFWDDGCFCMTYGDGDGTLFSPFTSLDVAGHEMTHGVTSATAGLVYFGEAGGMNEGFSDIMGTMVEFYSVENGAATETDYWIGEDIYTPRKEGDALRYMDDPTKDGVSIDHASKMRAWTNPHYSSGVPNNVFYLASEGGRNKTSGKTVSNPIGNQKAGEIFYRAVAAYMTPRSSFSQQRQATERAAGELYTSAEVSTMSAAWDACGVK